MVPAEQREPRREAEASTEARLRAAAIQLFASKGFQATGIRDLALAVNLSTAALYHYMGTKDDLLFAIMRDAMQQLIEIARKAQEFVELPEAKVAALTQVHVLSHALRRDQTIVADTEIRSLRGTHRMEVVALRDEYEGLWQDAIRQGQQAGVFTVADPRLARLALIDMCTGVTHWYSPKGPLPLGGFVEGYVDMVLALLRARRGRHLRAADLEIPDIEQYRDLLRTAWGVEMPTHGRH